MSTFDLALSAGLCIFLASFPDAQSILGLLFSASAYSVLLYQ